MLQSDQQMDNLHYIPADPSLFSYTSEVKIGKGAKTDLQTLTNDVMLFKGALDPGLIPLVLGEAVTSSVTQGRPLTKELNEQIITKIKQLIKGNDPKFEIQRADIETATKELNRLAKSPFPEDKILLASARQSGREYLKTYELYPPSE